MSLRKLLATLLVLANTLGMIPLASAAVMQSNGLGQNLLTYSEDFTQAVWQKNAATVSANSIAAPNGTLTADKLVESAGSNSHLFYRTSPSTVANPTFSVYAKAGERNYFQIADVNSGAMGGFVVDLNTGTITQNSINLVSSVTSVGNGWYRIAVRIATPSIVTISIGASDSATASGVYGDVYVGDGTSGLYLWGAQWVQGSKAGAYNPTGASARNTTFIPDGSTRSNQVGQNLLTYSEEFNNAIWVKSQSSVTADSVQSPLGAGTTADSLVEDGTSNYHYFTQSKTVPSGKDATFSIYAKAGGRNFIVLQMSGGVAATVCFNLTDGTYISSGGGNIIAKPVGNGWFRVSVTTLGATSAVLYLSSTSSLNPTYAGSNGLVATYAWGAQLVQNSQPSAYNPTKASAIGSSYSPSGRTQSKQLGQNLVTYSDPVSLADIAPDDQVTVAPYAWPVSPGLANAVSFGDNSVQRYAYKQFSVTAGTQYTLSFYVQTADSAIPIISSANAPSDFMLVFEAAQAVGTVSRVSDGVYRVSFTGVAASSGTTNFGAIKYTTNSTKAFKISGYQLVIGSKPAAYNPTKASAINASFIP